MTYFHQILGVDRLLEPGKENPNINTDIQIVRASNQLNKLCAIFFHFSTATKVNSSQISLFRKEKLGNLYYTGLIQFEFQNGKATLKSTEEISSSSSSYAALAIPSLLRGIHSSVYLVLGLPRDLPSLGLHSVTFLLHLSSVIRARSLARLYLGFLYLGL